jgi:hypothetical protein
VNTPGDGRRPQALILDAADDVAVATSDLAAGQAVVAQGAGLVIELTMEEPVAVGHKLSLRPLPAGHDVLKYGAVIGRMIEGVGPGRHVHVHNLRSLRAVAESSAGQVAAARA